MLLVELVAPFGDTLAVHVLFKTEVEARDMGIPSVQPLSPWAS